MKIAKLQKLTWEWIKWNWIFLNLFKSKTTVWDWKEFFVNEETKALYWQLWTYVYDVLVSVILRLRNI